MKYSVQRYIFLFFIWCSGFSLYAQEKVGFHIDFFGYIDNREYQAPYTEDKTYFGIIGSPAFYFKIDSNNTVYGGIHFRQEMGITAQNKAQVNPIAYYRHKSRKIDFGLGFIPRYQVLKNIPKMVLSDTLNYEKPNLEGMYFNYSNQRNYQQLIFIDWLSKQGKNQRERFLVGIQGKLKFHRFYFEHIATLYHNALTSDENAQQHIQDNAVVIARLGTDLSGRLGLDSLLLNAGYAIGFDRMRSVYPMQKKSGFVANIYSQYRNFYLNDELYLGQPQNIVNGDAFYHRKRYNRLDLGWMPFRRNNLEAKFTFSLHFSPHEIDNQQTFTVRYRFGQKIL